MSRPRVAAAGSTAELTVSAGSGNCTLSGYPELALVDGALAIPTTVNQQPGTRSTIRVTSGRRATASLSWSRVESNGEDCAPRSSLQVTLPGGGRASALWPTGPEGAICDDTITTTPYR